jgi:hypothetical protein
MTAHHSVGAPAGNMNHVTTGLYALAVSGRIPLQVKGGHNIRRAVRRMRKELIAEIQAVHGREASLYEHALIHSATRHEARARLLEALLAGDAAPVLVGERLAVLKEIGAATDSRDKAIKSLGINIAGRERKPWELIHSVPVAQPASPQTQTSPSDVPVMLDSNTPAGHVGDED